MATTIEQLELEVQSSAGSAVSGIDSLSASLAKLKAATKGGVGLRTVANQFNAFNTAMGNMDSSAPGRISSLASSLEKLRNLGSIKLSSTLATGITSIGQAASSIATTDFSGIERLSTSMRSLVGFSEKGFASTITALTKLPNVAETLNKMDLDKFTSQIQQLSSALSPLATQLDTIGNAFGRLPSNLRNAVSATERLTIANEKASSSYTELYHKVKMTISSMRRAASMMAGWITDANQYIEDMNLFNTTMGEYASQAQKYANAVSEAVGINPGEFMRNQGVFNTIIKGFGVTSDRAYTMSQNLTQLGYDIASFYNVSFENAMLKLQSGISGELEPLRRLGYDLSVARLQEEALALGITKKVSAMNQAEKSELRYYAIMTQVTDAQGDMARTLSSPANQLRVLQAQLDLCSQSLGNIFLPLLSAIIPYAIAAAKAIRYLIDAIASFFGYNLTDYTQSSSEAFSSLSSGVGDVTSGLSDATGAAKKLKTTLLGIDELNVFPDTSSSSSGSGSDSGTGSGGGLGIELPTYDFFKDFAESKVNEIFEEMKKHLKEIAELVTTIGTGLLAWKIATGVMDFLKYLSGFKGFSGGTGLLGGLLMLVDMNEFKKYLDDFLTNGASFQNIAGMISEFAGMLGDAFVILGNLKIGGALKIIQGVGELCVAIKDISENGINWNNVGTAIRGISNIAIGIGLITSNFQVVGIGMVLQGLLNVIPQIKNVITAIKTGDWSVVDWSDLVIGAIEVIGGIAVALGAFKGLGAVGKMTETSKAMGEVTTATTATSDATEVLNDASSGFSSKLTSLAKNLLLGIAIIAEVAVAAALIVGSIALLGAELQLVDKAWTPVIANAGTVAIAMGVGTAMLVAVGVVTAALGTAGGAMCAQLGIGIAVLAEISVAADLFVGEIAIMGALLDKVEQTWSPVIANAPTVKTGIVTGTALLVAVGVATAALGVATVASAGTIPLAIGLGTTLLVELAAAFVVFCESLVAVADELSNNLSPALIRLNGQLPGLTVNMQNFVRFMTEFADQVVAYTEANAISGLTGTIDTIIGWFTEDPIKKMADDVNDVYEQTTELNEKLNLAVPELETAVDLLTSYGDFLGKLGSLADCNVELSSGLYLNLHEIGKNLVTGFVDGIKSKSSVLAQSGMDFVNTLLTAINTTWTSITTFFTTSLTDIETRVKTSWTNIETNTTISWNSIKDFFSITWTAIKTIVTTNMTAIQSNITTYTTTITSTLTASWNTVQSQTNSTWSQMVSNAQSKFSELCSTVSTKMDEATTCVKNVKWDTLGRDLVDGLLTGLKSEWNEVTRWVNAAADELTTTLADAFEIHSPSRVWAEIGNYLDLGLQEGMQNGTSGLVATATQIASSMTDAANSAVEVSSTDVPSYRVNTATYGSENTNTDSTGGITTLLEQILTYIQNDNRNSDIKVNIDGREVFNAVVKENNRAIQRTGASPIRV